MVYGTPVMSEEDLIARVHGTILKSYETTGLIGSCVKLSITDVRCGMT